MNRRLASLALGVRFALVGGRGGWTRAAMTAAGVGLGVALLLVACSIPHMLGARTDRGTGRAVPMEQQVAASASTVVVADVSTAYRGDLVYGKLLRADGARPVVPPGVSALPAPGEMVVSPALARLLNSDSGALLRPRLPYRSVGTIGDAGLLGPNELAYYAGSDDISVDTGGQRIDQFGDHPQHEPFSPILVLLVIIGFVVLLVQVAIFVAAAVRFGGAGRDRRQAALRLVGADMVMARWVCAGEAVAASFLGVLVGGLLLLAFGLVTPHVAIWGISVYSADVRPEPLLAALVVLAVPMVAVLVTIAALRRVSVEPLGVVRQARGVRRRIWWRLVIPVLGLIVLYPAIHQMRQTRADPPIYPVAAGVALLLVGVTTVLPWLVEGAVRRLRGGGVPWQLAVRRLQLDSGTAARLVSGLAVAVAGGIGLQMLFVGVQGGFLHNTGQDPSQVQVVVDRSDGPLPVAVLRDIPGVRRALVFTSAGLSAVDQPDQGGTLVVGDCGTLSQLAAVDGCQDGDVFLVTDTNPRRAGMDAPLPTPGTRVLIGDNDSSSGQPWTIPAGARAATALTNASGGTATGVFATPGALPGISVSAGLSTAYLSTDRSDPDVLERIRNAAAQLSPRTQVAQLTSTRADRKFADVRRGLFIGVIAVLLLIGASLLVSMLEQLAERRRLLAMLVAVGTRRATLAWSVLWQATIPMLLGLALALVTGAGLGAILLTMVHEPIRLDWSGIGAIVSVAAGVVLLVTALSLPVLHRLMRTGGLRTE